MQLHAPALVGGILSKDRLANCAAHRRLLAGIGAQLAAQHPYGIAVIPALNRQKAEADGFACGGVVPGAGGKRRDTASSPFAAGKALE